MHVVIASLPRGRTKYLRVYDEADENYWREASPYREKERHEHFSLNVRDGHDTDWVVKTQLFVKFDGLKICDERHVAINGSERDKQINWNANVQNVRKLPEKDKGWKALGLQMKIYWCTEHSWKFSKKIVFSLDFH